MRYYKSEVQAWRQQRLMMAGASSATRVMVGKPVVAGTRIPVERVIAHLAHNPDLNDLFAAYPELTLEDVRACLHYAHHAITQTPG